MQKGVYPSTSHSNWWEASTTGALCPHNSKRGTSTTSFKFGVFSLVRASYLSPNEIKISKPPELLSKSEQERSCRWGKYQQKKHANKVSCTLRERVEREVRLVEVKGVVKRRDRSSSPKRGAGEGGARDACDGRRQSQWRSRRR